MKRWNWIDASKGIAILAVMVDHLYSHLYDDVRIQRLSFFSVSLFILISGITNALKREKAENGNYIVDLVESVKGIIIAWLLATLVYNVMDNRRLLPTLFWHSVIHFNASDPFYYVALYIQLMAVSKLLYRLVRYADTPLRQLLLTSSIAVASYFLSVRTYILDIYGGGGRLLGGTYLLLFAVGMQMTVNGWIKAVPTNGWKIMGAVSLFVVCMWGWIWKCGFKLDQRLTPGVSINPPGATIMVYSIAMLFFLYLLIPFFGRSHLLLKASSGLQFLGKHSLYIFLYHRLFLDYVMPPFVIYMPEVMRYLLYLPMMIMGSFGVELIVNTVKGWIHSTCDMMISRKQGILGRTDNEA